MRKRKPGQPRKVHYELIPRDSVTGHPMYALLEVLVSAHHHELRDARLALAWCTSWKPDVDGRVVLGKCKKASDLDRELAAFDFVILLSRRFWLDLRVSETQRRALLDHELMHATVAYDTRGEPLRDARDRIVYRIKRHEIEEFIDIVARYGTYKADLESFAAALLKQPAEAFTPCELCKETPGWVATVDLTQTARVTRCACWLRWSEQRQIAATA